MSERPPYIVFEARALPQGTDERGAVKYVRQNIVRVQQVGSRDVFEGVAEEWLAQCEADAASGRLPESWYRLYASKYRDFVDDIEEAVDGFDRRNWAMLGKDQLENLRSRGIVNVEGVASASDDALKVLGPGGPALRAKAKAFLDSLQKVGTSAAEIEKLTLEVADLKDQLAAARARNEELSQEVANFKRAAAPAPGALNLPK